QAGWLNVVTGWLGLPQLAWLQNPSTSLWSVLAAALWQDLPYNIIIFLAGLQSIPPVFYDAAKVDGATRRQRFRYITVPLLRRTFV
ncbi:carbohydrate ABC transporter permease, partial [Salmonella enterica]|uniref:carbohydrate ABC transporter permease n=1 Tax=Salmonella enterica TaxID=28901 RepID=UPI003297AE16